MKRPYLQSPVSTDMLSMVSKWHERTAEASGVPDTLWVVLDGALLGADDVFALRNVYGRPVQAFDDTALADYGELGLLLWRWEILHTTDGLLSLTRVLGAKPGVSFLRTVTDVRAVGKMLAWLAGVATKDGLALYVRIGDTRVLDSMLRQLSSAQRAHVQTVIHEWVWPDRDGLPKSEWIAGTQVAEDLRLGDQPFLLDDAQYGALLDDAAADMLYAESDLFESEEGDGYVSSERHAWIQQALGRAKALGLKSHQDRQVFVDIAWKVRGPFEQAEELGETWLRVRTGMASFCDEVERWSATEWRALERFWRAQK